MAHLIEQHDHLVLAGNRSAWHGIGTLVAHAPNAFEALTLAKLTWTVQKWTLTANNLSADGIDSLDVDEKRAIVRSDTREVLGVVGKDFQPLQNHELAAAIDALGEQGAVPRVESAGSLRNGREVFFLARVGSFTADDNGKDEVAQYLLFANGHEGSRSLQVIPTTIRVVCSNTLQAALSRAECAHVIKHTSGAVANLANIGPKIVAALKKHEDFATACKALAKRRMTQDELAAFFATAYSASIGGPVRDSKKSRKRAEKQLHSWRADMHNDKNQTAPETAWAALNVVTDWADHERGSRVDPDYSKLLGPGREIKLKTLGAALALVGA